MKKSNTNENLETRLEMAQRLKAARKLQNITQEKMAELLGVTYNNYVRIENGNQNLTIYHLRNIAQILSITSDTILFGVLDKTKAIDFDKYVAYAETFNKDYLSDLQIKIGNILELQKDKNK